MRMLNPHWRRRSYAIRERSSLLKAGTRAIRRVRESSAIRRALDCPHRLIMAIRQPKRTTSKK